MTAAPEATQPGETPEATPDAARTDAGAPAVALEAATSNQMGAYSQRELLFVAREAAGELSFRYIRNDGDPQNLEWCGSGPSASAEPPGAVGAHG